MQIYSYNTLNKFGNPRQFEYGKYFTAKQTFTSNKDVIEKGYTPYEIEIAQKYMRVKNPRKLIEEEVGTDWYSMDTIAQAMELIAKYKKYEISQNTKLKNLGQKINNIDKKSMDITKRDEEIINELEKSGIKNAIDKIKLAKTVAQEKRKKQVYEELNAKYIALETLKEKSFPNAVMIKGMDDKYEQEEVIKYLRRNNCEVLKLNFENIPLDIAHKEISACAKNIKNSGQHSILFIENFDKYTIPTEENFDFISRLKGFLCACSKNYNTTILVFESHPEKLDENIIGRHRFQKEIDVSTIKSDDFCEFTPKYDGYSLIYDDNENSHIDLYLGNFGTNKYTLWIDSEDPKQIRTVLDKIDKIKTINKFKDIKFVQFPCPNGFKELEGYNFYPESNVTTDYKHIYSYII